MTSSIDKSSALMVCKKVFYAKVMYQEVASTMKVTCMEVVLIASSDDTRRQTDKALCTVNAAANIHHIYTCT